MLNDVLCFPGTSRAWSPQKRPKQGMRSNFEGGGRGGMPVEAESRMINHPVWLRKSFDFSEIVGQKVHKIYWWWAGMCSSKCMGISDNQNNIDHIWRDVSSFRVGHDFFFWKSTERKIGVKGVTTYFKVGNTHSLDLMRWVDFSG
jgi:hypothetical protein